MTKCTEHRRVRRFPHRFGRTLVALTLATIFTVMVSGYGTVPTTPTVIASSLILLTQGNLASYQTSGKQNWQIPVASSSFVSTTSFGGPSTRTHLISDGHTLYTATDRLQATASSGRIRWQQSLSAPADDLLTGQGHLYVLSGSTIGTLSTWDSTGGTLLWVQPGASLPLGPWAALKSDGHLLFLGGEDSVVALDAETGKIVWHDDLDPGDGAEQLFIEHNIVLVQTGSKIMTLQSATGAVLWQRESQIQSWYVDQAQNRLYTVSIDVPDPVLHPTAPIWSGLRASDLTTGKQLWAIPQPLSVTGTSSIDANGILSADGTTAMTEWSLQGKQRWTHLYAGSPLTQIEAVPQTATDLIFAQDGSVVALNSQDGGQRWQQMFAGQASQLTVVQQQYWLMSPAAGAMAAYSLRGTQQWSLKVAPFEDIAMQ